MISSGKRAENFRDYVEETLWDAAEVRKPTATIASAFDLCGGRRESAKVNRLSNQANSPLILPEVYAYMPSPNGLCDESNVVCNADYGISISRGAFVFSSGQYIAPLAQHTLPDMANAGGILSAFSFSSMIL